MPKSVHLIGWFGVVAGLGIVLCQWLSYPHQSVVRHWIGPLDHDNARIESLERLMRQDATALHDVTLGFSLALLSMLIVVIANKRAV